MKKIGYFFVCFALVVLFLYGLNFYNSKKEFRHEFNFVVTKITEDGRGNLTFYSSEKNFYFINYRFYKKEGIVIGDKIVKKKNSKNLYIYRINPSTGKYELFLKKEPNGNVR